MKYRFIIIIIGLNLLTSAFGTTKKTFLTGTIKNSNARILILSYENKKDTCFLKNGTFYYSIQLSKPVYADLRENETSYQLFITPGDSLSMFLDKNNLIGSWKFTGKGSKYNTCMLNLIKMTYQFASQNQKLYNNPPEIFKFKLDSLQQELKKYLYTFCKTNGIDNQFFITTEGFRISYSIANLRFGYPSNYSRYTRRPFTDSTFYQFLDTLGMLSGEFLFMGEYKQYLQQYFELYVRIYENRYPEMKSDLNEKIRFEVIDNEFYDDNIKNYFYYNTMRQVIFYLPLSKTENMIKKFQEVCSDSAYITEIKEMIKKKNRLSPGYPAPKFIVYDSTGKEVSLNNFKGKILYIDFWATWCGPCKREMPYLETLAKDYADSSVVVVSISLDEDYNAWRNHLKSKPAGIQLYAGNGFSSGIANDYFVGSIPLFVLIDKEGMIYRYPAGRPSSAEIRNDINKLIRLSAY